MTLPFIHAAVVVDRSGSMLGKERLVQQNLNRLFAQFRDSKVPMSVSLFSFNSVLKHEWTRKNTDLPMAPMIYTDGGTWLYGILPEVCERLYAEPTPPRHDPVYIVHVLTDGKDQYTPRPWKDTVARLYKAPNWTFAIVGPENTKRVVAQDLDIPADIIHGWDGKTEQSYSETQVATRQSYDAYVDAITRGKKKVDKFYASVKTDFSGYADMGSEYKEHKVTADTKTEDWFLGKFKKPYVKGAVLYELIKDELVQGDKVVVVKHKTTGRTHLPSREDLGLKSGEDAKVTPGNFGDWRVFVQNKAPNRKLPRGSRVLTCTRILRG